MAESVWKVAKRVQQLSVVDPCSGEQGVRGRASNDLRRPRTRQKGNLIWSSSSFWTLQQTGERFLEGSPDYHQIEFRVVSIAQTLSWGGRPIKLNKLSHLLGELLGEYHEVLNTRDIRLFTSLQENGLTVRNISDSFITSVLFTGQKLFKKYLGFC